MATKVKTHRELVLDAVTILAEAFGRTFSDVTVRAYELGLKDVPAAGLAIATERALATCKFMPSPAELRELSATERLEERALKAWLAVSDAVQRHGYIRSVTFDDVVINAAIHSLGGLERLCDTPADKFDVFTRKDFETAYVRLARAGVSGEITGPLIGWSDRENARNGYPMREPTVVVTGLPALPGAKLKPTLTQRPADLPRLELKKA
jgi:hypothetical protein